MFRAALFLERYSDSNVEAELMSMLNDSTLVIVAMVAMMALMCGGMIVGGAWAFLRGRKKGAPR
jgi:hypothetical protein